MLAPALGHRVGPIVKLKALPGGDAGQLGLENARDDRQVLPRDETAQLVELYRIDWTAAHRDLCAAVGQDGSGDLVGAATLGDLSFQRHLRQLWLLLGPLIL